MCMGQVFLPHVGSVFLMCNRYVMCMRCSRLCMGQSQVRIYARISISHALSVEAPATLCTLGKGAAKTGQSMKMVAFGPAKYSF